MGRYLVLGSGRSGKAAAALLEASGREVVFADDFSGVVVSPGVPVKSELQFGCEELKRRGWRLLAVTGSKGKSSVVKVVADALSLAGMKAVPCGNYGRPVCDLVGEEPGWAVVEVSSFQLETTALAGDTFEAAAVLNVQEDHLDRHGSVSVYRSLKLRLSEMAKAFYCERAPENCDSLIAGSYFDNDVLRANGAHAVALMRAAGLSDAQIRRGFEAFVPLPHRFQTVAELDGVRFVDDSKATSVAALAAGVSMCAPPDARNVRLIAGGRPKGDDPAFALPALTKRVRKVYLIGECAESFGAAWRSVVECEMCGTIDRAVAAAVRDAEKGDVVLLSPGAASFDQFGGFGERGDVFAGLVKIQGQRKK
jgi:UDP-N-acetylmuramoylalanine--D-glutamate ligase